jgi:hypothetical protein
MLWVQVQGAERFGPYPDWRWDSIAAFARIGSQTGAPRAVLWGGNRPTRTVRIYVRGNRRFPETMTAGQREAERLFFAGRKAFQRKPKPPPRSWRRGRFAPPTPHYEVKRRFAAVLERFWSLV